MITDKETDLVYFSALLENDTRFPGSFKRITDILEKHSVRFDTIKGTRDVWARDYMPIQIEDNRYIQFRYEPSYLNNNLEIRSVPEHICMANYLNPDFSKINLDGGNVIRWYNKVIISDRLYTENLKHTNKTKLVSELSKRLEADVIIIPQIFSDFTGHADGMVRFYNENTLIGNDRKIEYKYWVNSMNKVLRTQGLEYIDMPLFVHKKKKFRDSAIGCYMNYLEIGNLIIFPVFEIEGNKDYQALDLIKSIYPTKQIESVNINDIANHGGLMNCISWNIKSRL